MDSTSLAKSALPAFRLERKGLGTYIYLTHTAIPVNIGPASKGHALKS